MDINLHNYEAYLLDYFENNLTAEQVAELLVFLQSHPELNIDLEGFQLINLQPDSSVVFADKSSLKHSDVTPYSKLNQENYEEYFVASVDGELSVEEEKDLEIFVGLNPHLKSEYDLFSLTVLTPDTGIKYPGKSALKKGAFGVAYSLERKWLYSSISVAAGIALLMGFYFFNNSPIPTSGKLAQAPSSKAKVVIAPDTQKKDYTEAQSNVRTLPDHSNISKAELASAEPEHPKQSPDRPGIIVKPISTDIFALTSLGTPELSLQNHEQSSIVDIPRSYYTELYGYLQQREQREYQEYLAAREARPWYAKAFGEVRTLVAGPDIYDPTGVKRDNEMWMLAEAGIKGINYLTNSNFHLRRQLDEDGRTSAYAVASRNFEYSGKIEK